jgi:hypothetical protein
MLFDALCFLCVLCSSVVSRNVPDIQLKIDAVKKVYGSRY